MNSVLRRNLAKLQCALKKDLNFNTGNCFFTRNLNIGVQGAGYGGGQVTRFDIFKSKLSIIGADKLLSMGVLHNNLIFQPKSGLIHGPELIRGSGFIQFLVDEGFT